MATLTPTRLEALPFPSSPHVSPSARSTRQDAILSFRRSGSSPSVEAPPEPISRTIAVLTRSAAKVHCPAILARASAFGLRVLADREERWLPTDVDFLDAFLRAETQAQRTAWMQRLTRAEIRVVVLEGKGAARLWNSLIGRDAELEPPNEDDDDDEPSQAGLRRTYGDASLYGSVDNEAAERQIAYCFPELALPGMLETLALEDQESSLQPQHDYDEDELDAEPIDEQELYASDEQQYQHQQQSSDEQHYDDGSYDEHGALEAHSSSSPTHLKPQMPSRSNSFDNGFKARPLPESTRAPKLQPRLSKAAALRMGIEPPSARRMTDEEKAAAASANAELGISGLPLTQRERPKSIAAPSLAPRMNRAAAIRAGLDVPAAAPRERSVVPAPVSPEIGISGLRRVEAAPPKSIATPSMAPRMNRAAAIRAGIEVAAPPARRAAPPAKTAPDADVGISGLKKSSVVLPKSLAAPSLAPRANRASAARAGGVTSPIMTRSNSMVSGRTSSISSTASGPGALTSSTSVQNAAHAETDAPAPFERERKPVDFGTTPGHKRAASSISGLAGSLKSLQAPSIAPRGNRASSARETGALPMERSRTESSSATLTANKRASVDFSQTPGHNRRNSMTITPKSLGQPSIVPRSNNAAAARRLSVGAATVEAPLRVRPSSSAGTAVGTGSRPASAAGTRPASRGSNAAPPPHQDAPPTRVRGAAPPSSYRAVY